MKSQPIGIFDSGVGGLSVALAIREQLPWEDLIYVADSAHTPYGNKTTDFIVQRAISIVEFMLSQNVKAVVVACNTATVSAIAELRRRFTLPIIGMEPGVKPAAELSSSGVVGVLATTQTLKSEAFLSLVSRFAQNRKVVAQACPGLVEVIEKMELDSESTQNLVSGYLQPLLEKGADKIVLGCTHYSFLSPLIESLIQGRASIINTNQAVAREVVRRLQEQQLLDALKRQPTTAFFSSAEGAGIDQVLSYYWGESIRVREM